MSYPKQFNCRMVVEHVAYGGDQVIGALVRDHCKFIGNAYMGPNGVLTIVVEEGVERGADLVSFLDANKIIEDYRKDFYA